ncbi:MAG: hypothetical protein J6S03_05650, partial [Bacteroidaceae bacterium]|nr:hypothetical protein [Bacteroidaceae bacterium]
MKKLCSLFVAASMLLLVGCEIRYNGVAVQLNNECTYILDEELLASLELSGGVDVVVDTAMAKNKVRVVSNTDDFSKLVVKAE